MKRTRRSTRQNMLALVTEITEEPELPVVAKRLQDAGLPVVPNVAQALKAIAGKLSGSAKAREQLATVLADLSASTNPAAALVNFLRYLDATGAAGVVLSTVAAGKPPRELLATIFGASQDMSDIVIRKLRSSSGCSRKDRLSAALSTASFGSRSS